MSYHFTDPTNEKEYEVSLSSFSDYPGLRIQDLEEELKQYSNPQDKIFWLKKYISKYNSVIEEYEQKLSDPKNKIDSDFFNSLLEQINKLINILNEKIHDFDELKATKNDLNINTSYKNNIPLRKRIYALYSLLREIKYNDIKKKETIDLICFITNNNRDNVAKWYNGITLMEDKKHRLKEEDIEEVMQLFEDLGFDKIISRNREDIEDLR